MQADSARRRKLGLELTVNDRGRLIVSKLSPGPILNAGIQEGDELVEVGEGEKTFNQPFSNLAEFLNDGASHKRFGFLRPGLSDILVVELDQCCSCQSDSFRPEKEPRNGMQNKGSLLHYAAYHLSSKQQCLPRTEWTKWDGPEDEPEEEEGKRRGGGHDA